MTIAALIARFGSSVTVTRKGAGAYVNGVFVAGATSSLALTAAVQPLNGREFEALPTGERTTETLKMYSVDEILPPKDDANIVGDVVSFDGKTYRVKSVERWVDSGLPFYKSILARVPA
jgi:hypothetical protein